MGPYCEAVESIDHLDRLRLILLASRHPGPSLSGGWRLRELAHEAPTGDMRLDAQLLERFGELARMPATGGFAPHEDVEVFQYAIEGLARLGGSVPPVGQGLSHEQSSWRLIAQLLVDLHRGERSNGDTWAELHEVAFAAVPDVLSRIRASQMSAQFRGERGAYDLLVGAYPDEVRCGLHWALEHLGVLTSLWTSAPSTSSSPWTTASESPRWGALHAINGRLTSGGDLGS